MDVKVNSSASQIVLPAAPTTVKPLPPQYIGRPFPKPIFQQWAPAWFYSALHWLGKSYYDASGTQRSFSSYMAGSSVDPYAQLGATRLFFILYEREQFRMMLAADIDSSAPLSGGKFYENSDSGILSMYDDLAASSIFSSVNFCYIPGRIGDDLDANAPDAFATGYDPATGMRTVVLGSAVSQIVPLNEFINSHNQQIYDDSPSIVPLTTCLVFDVTQNNALDASTFILPVLYSRDQVSAGNFYVNKLGWSTAIAGDNVNYGQAAVFPGGPGYNSAAATPLTVKSTSAQSTQGQNFTHYDFGTATAVTTSTLNPDVMLGVMSLTYSGATPSSIFANQQIIGFYRDASWATCLGIPIYDYGSANQNLSAAALPLNTPTPIYSPTTASLNGGTLQNVARKLSQATYLYSSDQLVSMLNSAIAVKGTASGAGLSVTTAALNFAMSSSSAASVVNQLTVPVVATVTTTPPKIVIPENPVDRANIPGAVQQSSAAGSKTAFVAQARPAAVATAPGKSISQTLNTGTVLQNIGTGANNPTTTQLAPVTVEVSLQASIPREALSNTGINAIEAGTIFFQQELGDGAALEALTSGMVVNLANRNLAAPSLASCNLATATAGVAFTAGVYYVLCLTGTSLSVRGSDGSSVTSAPALPGPADVKHTYVGAMVYSVTTTSVELFPLLQLTLAAPPVGAQGVQQSASYSVRLTYGDNNSTYDILDSTQTVIASGISVPNPKATDGSSPSQGDLYFGSFTGGASQMTVWSVPVFLTVAPSQLTGASFFGTMTLGAQAAGLPEYQLQITDSSLFVYSNFNVDTGTVGSVSSSNIFLASAVINSAPDNQSAAAFAPCKLLMGIIRQAQMGILLEYVFVPEDDSVVIGGTRYMVSVVNLGDISLDPNSLPYPPVYWPQMQYWQFANRHNPYLDVRYTGESQQARISQAQSDTARIGLQLSQTQEPMQMYLDTNSSTMTVWPIFEFPYAESTQLVDIGQLKSITSSILSLLSTSFPAGTASTIAGLDAEQISVPGALQQNNPYTADAATTTNTNATVSSPITSQVAGSATTAGVTVTNLNPGSPAATAVMGLDAQRSFDLLQSQQTAANQATTKSLAPEMRFTQSVITTGAATAAAETGMRQFLSIFGFTVYNPGTGEAYIVEVVNADQTIPNQIPGATQNATYDPYFVRVVFLNTLTCYNMSIIVPSMVYDQYNHLAHQGIAYQNVLSKTDELAIGYLYSLYDSSNNFDSLNFSPYPAARVPASSSSESYLFTNLPYSTEQLAVFNPGSLFGSYADSFTLGESFTEELKPQLEKAALAFDTSQIEYFNFATPPAYFVCRRQNWNADCHLMQATNPSGTSVFMAFGGGDLVPFRLDASFTVDHRLPAHMSQLTYTFADQQYDSAKTILVNNTPHFVAVTTAGNIAQYMNFSINATAGTAQIQTTENKPIQFPTECYVVGQTSTTLTSIDAINSQAKTAFVDTGGFVNQDGNGNILPQQFQLITYNNLVYMIRAVANVSALGVVGGLGITSGLLIDTLVPSTTGNFVRAQAARYQRSGMQYFGTTYTPTTMVDTLDTLNFTSISGEFFYAPTIFIPIAELDSAKGFIADLSNFLGQEIWTFIYPEITAQAGETVNGVPYPNGYNLDVQGKPILSLQKLQFVYDSLAVMFTTNDLTHKYPLQAKQQILALTNGQVQEGICWRSANVEPGRLAPHNICAQQILPSGPGMDRPNIIYSPQNRPVITSIAQNYMGMSVNSIVSLSGAVYNIEESALSAAVANDSSGAGFISSVSSIANMVIGVLFDYDNNDQGTLSPYDSATSTKGLIFLNGYLGASGYAFSSPDHFDVNDVLPEQVPLLEQITGIMGTDWDVSFYNIDMGLPNQYWSLVYDTFTAVGLPNYIPNVPPSAADPTFINRTRSLILSLQNPVRPTELGLIDTYESVVSANLHLQNGVTGAIFLSKKADRDIASIGTNPQFPSPLSTQLYGLSTKYDFFLFSRNHYWTLKGALFELIDMGYAMCLVDNGTGTGAKIAQYYIDADGNYYELYYYVLYSADSGIIESNTFTLKVTLGAPANPGATPPIAETPNNVNPQDLVTQINKLSNVIYAAFGPSSPGQPPAYIPIQAVGGEVQAAPISGAPGFNGYNLNVASANQQPVLISQIYSANLNYPIAGSTTIVPYNVKAAKSVPFYGSLSHELDKQVSVPLLQSANLTSFIPAVTVPPGPSAGVYGGNGLGSLIDTPFSCAFQGSGAIPPAISSDPTPGTVMKGDATVFYTYNAVTNIVMDSTGKSVTVTGGQYFVDTTDPSNPIYGVVSLPKFLLNGNTCTINLSTTLSDGVTSRYTLVIEGHSYQFSPDNAHVTVDRTQFTFNKLAGGVYTVTYAALDSPAENEAPTPIPLTQFSITVGGVTLPVDVFNLPANMSNMILGVNGRQYTYNPVAGTVTVTQGTTTTTVPLATGLICPSNSAYGYVIGFSNEQYTVNGSPMYPYTASTSGAPATYALMTSPQMFTIGGNFYTFDQVNGAYVSVTGNGQVYPVNPYQFSINGDVYIINTNVQPYAVVGGGNVYTMTAGNTQFLLNGVQYTITLKSGSLNGATVSGQFNITQGNVVVLENYVYQLDTLNGQIVGNGTTYPLTTSGFTYTITTLDSSFNVTTKPNAATVTIGNINYVINNTTVVGDGIIYPILAYRTFTDGSNTFRIGFDGTVSVGSPFLLTGKSPYTGATFTDTQTYTVNELAAFDGTNYYVLTGTPPQFTAGAVTYTLRTDGVSILAGAAQTYLVNPTGPLSPNQFVFGTETISFGRPTDIAAFDGQHFYSISNGAFTDTNTGLTYTLSGNTAVNEGNSFEIYSNLGQNPYFEVPNGPTYFVNIPVADTNGASGNIYSVFPVSSGGFTIPLIYTVTVSGSDVTVNAATYTGGATIVSTLTALGGSLTGGYFQDPVTQIVYTCIVEADSISFVDSNNTVYPYPATGTTDTFVANVVVTTAVFLAVNNAGTPAIYPIINNQYVVGSTTFFVNLPVAYVNSATGPIWPMVNGRFIVPQASPISSIAYTVQGGSVTKGYVLSADDEFSADGDVVYTMNDVNVVKATSQATLSGTAPNQTLVSGTITYTLNSTTSQASFEPSGISYNTTTKQFTVSYNSIPVTYSVGASSVTDSRNPTNSFSATISGNQVSFIDTVSEVQFSFDSSGNNPVTVGIVYSNDFFVDLIDGVTYYIDASANKVEALSYLPETTQYAFTPATGTTYLIHYSNVNVVFPVIAGPNVNVGVATVGSDTFTVDVDEVQPAGGGTPIPINQNSFEVNGNLYTIIGTPSGANYSSCQVVGAAMAPKNFLSANTFKLGDPNVVYTLQLDANNLPDAVVAEFAVLPSCDLIDINDDVYILTYNTVSSGSLLGQGQAAIPIANSSFTLTNPLDSTKAKFIFDDLDIYDAGSVVGQFTIYLAPTFFIGSATYTLNPSTMSITDNNKRLYPLIQNPTMFSINGFNYVIDTNRVPHTIVGNNNVSPLSTDVLVQGGQAVPATTFTLNGQIYAYVEDAQHNLLAVTGTKTYPISQPALTFKLGSSLLFTISETPPAVGNYAGTTVPIGTITSGTLILNIYAGIPESGNVPFFTYKNILYTLIQSEGTYVAVQQTYTVYASTPVSDQQQLAVFDLSGTTYIVTDGSTPGVGPAAGINTGTLWAETSISTVETQFGVVYGFAAQPVSVTQSGTGVFQFEAANAIGTNTLYNILYTKGGNTNVVQVDVPDTLPAFMQSAPFTFITSYPLTFETGGYNAFTTFVSETATPSESFSGAYRTPITSTDSLVNSLMSTQGDFSLEFWHSLPVVSQIPDYHPFTYSASTAAPPLVYFVDVDFSSTSDIYVQINKTVMRAFATPPVFSSGWRHFALTYTQPYVILCQGAGFEVKQGSNYDFSRDFSIVMTIAASDVTTEQGLLYKGTGSHITPPELAMSYRVTLNNGAVTMQITDGTSNESPVFTGPAIEAGKFYEIAIVKNTVTPAGNSSSTDPYAPPTDPSEFSNAASGGASFNGNGIGSGSGPMSLSNVGFGDPSSTPNLTAFLNKIQSTPSKSYSYNVTISVRLVNDDGSTGNWNSVTSPIQTFTTQAGLLVNPTGPAHLLIGSAYDDYGTEMPLGSSSGSGNIRDLYLFNSAITTDGQVNSATGPIDVAAATPTQLAQAGIIGFWSAAYDPDGVVNNTVTQSDVAVSTNASLAYLAPLTGHELDATALYINGYPMTLQPASKPPSSMTGYVSGTSLLNFNAGLYKLEEISIWSMARQPYQIIDDMFGRLVPSNEPFLVVYLSGSFLVPTITGPILPMNQYIDNTTVTNPITSMDLTFTPASIDLSGCPDLGRCGPLITPSLYTPPGVALTISDSIPYLTTYSVTLNSVTGTLAGEINEAYVYVNNNVLTLFAGKKVGDLVLTWVSQEQGNAQIIGYAEGAPPCPMANLTNKSSYSGATSVSFTVPTSVSVKYQQSNNYSNESKTSFEFDQGAGFGLGLHMHPIGFGLHMDEKAVVNLTAAWGAGDTSSNSTENDTQNSTTEKLEESSKYTVKMEGTLSPYTNDLFMSSLNTLTTPSNTAGNPSSKTAILPNPNLGGFTTSNPPTSKPKTAPTEEKFGQRIYAPSPYGQAFVVSQTLDVYQQTLVQTNTVYGFVAVPNTQIPRDLNIVSFRLNSGYIRPGCLDGVVGYVYNPATLANGSQTYTTSTGQLQTLYDGNFSSGDVGHNASYMRVVEAYQIKKQVDQQAFNSLALYYSAYETSDNLPDPSLTPALDFYNEYVWSSRGGSQEVKHTYSTSVDEVYTTSNVNSDATDSIFNIKLTATTLTILNIKAKWTNTTKSTVKYSYTCSAGTSFDVAASFSGIESDTQMRYECNNDAHFVMNFNSMFNPNNQSGLNLVIGSDGLVYNIVPSVTSGAGVPVSNNIDTSQSYTQPQPSYTTGNASGTTGNLEPYDRPGKTNLFRTYLFFRQAVAQNDTDFWNTVVDTTWLNNSSDADAATLRNVTPGSSIPWRLLYRVTYSERFLPPISNAEITVPQITPLMAVPVTNPVSDFIFQNITPPLPRPAHNPANDIDANVVLAAPTASGLSAGTTPTSGPSAGIQIVPNNVITFDLVKSTNPIVNWGDTANTKIITQLITSALGQNTVNMSTTVLPGSTLVATVTDPASGQTLYSIYTDPNGLAVNVPLNFGITVYQDVNGNPIQYFDGHTFHSLQADYVASPDGTIMYYIQPPSNYDQSAFNLLGDYDLFGNPGDEWRYFLVSGTSTNMTSDATVSNIAPFFSSTGASAYTGFTIAPSMHAKGGATQVQGYVLVQGVLQWPNLNVNSETFADVQVYKAMSLLDTFPIGDEEVLVAFLEAQYPNAPFTGNAEINLVFAKNILSYFNSLQQVIAP